MAKRYVSIKDETVRLFQNDFMEFWSRVHPSVPVILYLPLIVYLLYQAATSASISAGGMILLFFSGWFAWTLTEYLLHRFLFHFTPRGALQQRIFYLFHGIHHDYPTIPGAWSCRRSWRPLAVIFYTAFNALMGKPHIQPFFAGFVFGYLCYDLIHYAVHHWPLNHGVALFLRQYHIRHHYQDEERSYGVSSPLWDYVFGTRPSQKGREQQRTQEFSATVLQEN
jgi:sterol desaturase/sphingolipid hydroxylase (fatty acid hydroxylase superfamily)